MHNKLHSLTFAAAGLVVGALILTGCDRGPDGSEEAAARENVEAMAREHADDTAEPSPAAETPPAREVTSERLPYGEVGEELVYGHFVFPADMIEPLPAVIMIHEWWGLNDNIRAMADRLAAEGYIVLAIDLFGGETAADPESARNLMLSVVENQDDADTNIRQAYDFVSAVAGATRVASLGWCFGGGWSLNSALLLPEQLDAAVIYYGQVTSDDDKLRPVQAPILGLFGAEDRGISVESVRGFEAALERLGKDHEIHVYPGAGHAFANPTGRNYMPEAAEDAWRRTLDFLRQKLADPAAAD